MEFYELLTQIGVDGPSTVARLGGMETLLKRFILKFPQDPTFSSLARAYDSRDMEALELYVHTLKGLAANLGIEPLRRISVEYLEQIRKNVSFREITIYQRQLTQEYHRITEAINRFLREESV